MQSIDPSKSFTIGNLCVRDDTEVITIVNDFENLTIDNNTVWGAISRVTNNSGIGGEIVGNLLGYGCRFEIAGSSFNLGTILNPTSLKIFSKDKKAYHAVFDKDTGALVLGVNKSSTDSKSILETWGGISHWRGQVKFKDTVAFLPPLSSEQILEKIESTDYIFSIPSSQFPLNAITTNLVDTAGKTLICEPTDFVIVNVNGNQVSADSITVLSNSITFSTPISAASSNPQSISVSVYKNDDASLKEPTEGGVKFLTEAIFYSGSSISFSSMENPNEESVFENDISPKLVIKGPETIDLGTDPIDVEANKIELVLPGKKPDAGAFLTYKDRDVNLAWSRDIFSDLAKSVVGVESLTTSQLLGLIMEMKKEIERLSGKKINIVDDYESALGTGGVIVLPGGEVGTPTNGETEPPVISAPQIIRIISPIEEQNSEVTIGQLFTVQVAFSGTDGATSPGPAISISHSPNLSGDSATGGAWGLPKWDPFTAVYNFPFTALESGPAWISISAWGATGGNARTIDLLVL